MPTNTDSVLDQVGFPKLRPMVSGNRTFAARKADSATNQVKARLLKLNSEAPCPPRGAVPVFQGRNWELFALHARFAFGDRCDCPAMSAIEIVR